MKLFFKNKMIMAIEHMIKEGVEKAGGIPKEIQLTREEVGPFLREIFYLKKEAKNGNLGDRANIVESIIIDYTVSNFHQFDGMMFKWNNPNLSQKEYIGIVKAWSLGALCVFYKYNGQKIPIRIPKLKEETIQNELVEEKGW